MTSRLRIWQWIVVGITAIVVGFIGGVFGLIVGATYGGNFCTEFQFNGVRGYEATGQIGFLVGGTVGFILSAWGTWALLRWRNIKRKMI